MLQNFAYLHLTYVDFLFVIIALLISWIWIDYFRMIDIFKRVKLKHILPTFILGGMSVAVVTLATEGFIEPIGFRLQNEFWNDFIYIIFAVGLLEELAKAIPFLIALALFKKHINEPLDLIVLAAASALGFAAVENTIYFHFGGSGSILGRSTLSTITHMFCSSIVAYGFVRHRFHPSRPTVWSISLYIILAALSHGLYDFWLVYQEAVEWHGIIITIFYFMLTISWFATMLNNALNNSPFFTYKKMVNPHKVSNRLFLYYGTLLGLAFITDTVSEDLGVAIGRLLLAITTTGFILIICILRLSRFKLIQNRWFKLKVELPFSLNIFSAMAIMPGMGLAKIRVKGEAFNEYYINQYFEEEVYVKPVRFRNSYLGGAQKAEMVRKIFLKDDESFYLTSISFDDAKPPTFYLIKPKMRGETKMKDGYPIVALFELNSLDDCENTALTLNDFKFIEWVYIKSKEQEENPDNIVITKPLK